MSCLFNFVLYALHSSNVFSVVKFKFAGFIASKTFIDVLSCRGCYGLSLLLERDVSDTSRAFLMTWACPSRLLVSHSGEIIVCVYVSVCVCVEGGKGEVGKSCG